MVSIFDSPELREREIALDIMEAEYYVNVRYRVGKGRILKKKFKSKEKYEASKHFSYWAHRMLEIYDDQFDWKMGA